MTVRSYESARWMMLAGQVRIYPPLLRHIATGQPDIVAQFAVGDPLDLKFPKEWENGAWLYRFGDGSTLVVTRHGDCHARPPDVRAVPTKEGG